MAAEAGRGPDEGCAPEASGPEREAGDTGLGEQAFGSYAGGIREGVANCAACMDQLAGQLRGTPSRRSVADQAQALRNAAGSLAKLCHEVEVWLGYCGAQICLGDSGWTDECLLPAGHDGAHQADTAPPALQLAWARAGRVAAVATVLADCLGGLMHDQGRPVTGPLVEELGRTYRQLRREVDRFRPLLAELRLAAGITVQRRSVDKNRSI